MTASGYRAVSLWMDQLAQTGDDQAGDDLAPRPSLADAPADSGGARDVGAQVDVAIIGGGLTGLWTAYYLSRADPMLSIMVLEKEIVGFGASGRNGGWCSALFAASAGSIARRHGEQAALDMRQAMTDTVDEVGRVVAAEHIDCDFAKGGTVTYARSAPQLAAARAHVEDARRWGDQVALRAAAPGDATGTLAATVSEACARLQPAKLVRGLARVVEARGVRIHERTEVTSWRPGMVQTVHGEVPAAKIVVATEGFGATITQTHRRVLPLYSLVIATEPLPASVWETIGIDHGQTFSDYRHLIVYGQRTADDRLVFGGRGARYHWGSTIRPGYDRVPRVFTHLQRTLGEMFPVVADAAITHRWGGPLGVPRDWHASVQWDGAIGSAGGYVGDGVSTTNLAGRTLADLILGVDSPLTRLPWVGHRSRSWEPEPLRFAGANAGLLAMDWADREERLTRRPSVIARLMAPLTGR